MCPCSVSSCHRGHSAAAIPSVTGRQAGHQRPHSPRAQRSAEPWKPFGLRPGWAFKARSIRCGMSDAPLKSAAGPSWLYLLLWHWLLRHGWGLEAGIALGELFEISPHPTWATAPNARLEDRAKGTSANNESRELLGGFRGYLGNDRRPPNLSFHQNRTALGSILFICFCLRFSRKRGIPWLCCSVAQSCLTLCDPVDCSMPGFPVLHYFREFTQTHVHWISDAIQPSRPLPMALLLLSHFSLVRLFVTP